MDGVKLQAALGELDWSLTHSVDVVIVGGAAMIMRFGARRATLDVDYFLVRGDASELCEAIDKVSRSRGLPPAWMNDAVKGFTDLLPPDFVERMRPLELGLEHLRVFTLGAVDQATMKLVALRESDLEG